jgi:hypothetical protein
MKRLLLILFLLSSFVGCATKPQGPVAFDEKKLDPRRSTIGIVMSPVPAVAVSYPGANCLICVGAAKVINSALEKHTSQLATDELKSIEGDLEKKLSTRGFRVNILPKEVIAKPFPEKKATEENQASRDYSRLKSEYEIDKFLFISVAGTGFDRRYADLFPTSPPMAVTRGVVSLVDIETGSFLAYKRIELTIATQGDWDEPDRFPGLTAAYYEAIERFKDETLKTFD